MDKIVDKRLYAIAQAIEGVQEEMLQGLSKRERTGGVFNEIAFPFVALLVSGTWISGQPISERLYVRRIKQLAQKVPKDESGEAFINGLFKDLPAEPIAEVEEEQVTPHFIYLDACVAQVAGHLVDVPPQSVRLADVSSWSLGALSRS